MRQEPDGRFKYIPWDGEMLNRKNSTVWRLTGPEQVAVYLSITVKEVEELMQNTKLPYTVKKVGNKLRYSFLIQNVSYNRKQ